MSSVSKTTLVILLIAVIAIAAAGTFMLFAPLGQDTYSIESLPAPEVQGGQSGQTTSGQVTVIVVP